MAKETSCQIQYAPRRRPSSRHQRKRQHFLSKKIVGARGTVPKKQGENMRFLREYIIIIIILGFVFLMEYLTSKSLGEATQWMKDGVISIENKIKENQEPEAQQEFYDLQGKWKDKTEKLALFVEHNELEKVSNDIALIEINFETDETEDILENIAELKFMLEHIEEKNQLKLKNIF